MDKERVVSRGATNVHGSVGCGSSRGEAKRCTNTKLADIKRNEARIRMAKLRARRKAEKGGVSTERKAEKGGVSTEQKAEKGGVSTEKKPVLADAPEQTDDAEEVKKARLRENARHRMERHRNKVNPNRVRRSRIKVGSDSYQEDVMLKAAEYELASETEDSDPEEDKEARTRRLARHRMQHMRARRIAEKQDKHEQETTISQLMVSFNPRPSRATVLRREIAAAQIKLPFFVPVGW